MDGFLLIPMGQKGQKGQFFKVFRGEYWIFLS